MSAAPPGRRAGRILLILAWGAGLFLTTRFFASWEARQENPNTQVVSSHGDGYVEVRLASNHQGHFMASGYIDGHPVRFMLDTGATQVAIPSELADTLALQRGTPVTVSTANGRTDAWRTRIDRLQLGEILLRDVRGLIVPGLDGDDVLLGMSAMQQLEFSQRSGTLLLRQTTR